MAAAAMTLIFPSWRVVVGVAGGAGAGQGEEGCVGISALVSGGEGPWWYIARVPPSSVGHYRVRVCGRGCGGSCKGGKLKARQRSRRSKFKKTGK